MLDLEAVSSCIEKLATREGDKGDSSAKKV